MTCERQKRNENGCERSLKSQDKRKKHKQKTKKKEARALGMSPYKHAKGVGLHDESLAKIYESRALPSREKKRVCLLDSSSRSSVEGLFVFVPVPAGLGAVYLGGIGG